MKLQLKRSLKTLTDNITAQSPTVDQMEYGELAINYAATDATIFLKDSNNVIQKLQVSAVPDVPAGETLDDRYVSLSGSTLTGNLTAPSFVGGVARTSIGAPTTGQDGELWWNTSNGRLYIYDGDNSSWVDASPDSFTLGAGYFDKNESDARYVAKAGSTMTGPLLLSGNPGGEALAATPKQYVDGQVTGLDTTLRTYIDAQIATRAATTYVNTQLALKADTTYVTSAISTSEATAATAYVSKSGDVISGDLTANAFIGDGSQLTGVGSETIISNTPPTPANYEVGTMWWNSDSSDTSLYILYQDPIGPNGDPGGKYWIEASPAPDSIGFNGSHSGDSTFTGDMDVTGHIISGTYAANSDYAALRNHQLEIGKVTSDDNAPVFAFTRYDGGTASENILFKADGSATFAGDVNIGEYDGNSTTSDGVLLGSVGGVYSQLAAATAGTGVLFQGMHGASATSVIKANGSATFGNTVASPSFFGNGTGDSQVWYGGATGTSIIKADGSATFAGDGHFKCGGTAHAEMGVQFINDGEVKIYRPTGGGGTVNLISGSAGVGSPSEQFAIKADGSASFGFLDLGSTTAYGATIDQTAGSHSGVRVQSTDTATTVGEFFAGYRGSSLAFQVTTGGALKAASGAFEVDDSGIIQTNINTAGIVKLNSTADFANPKIELNSIDGSATFAGNVMAEKSVNLTNGYGAGTDSNAALFTRNAANDTTTSMINYDGSATFAGGAVSLEPNVGVTINDGTIDLYLATSTPAAKPFKVQSDVGGTKVEKCSIAADGSATFNGKVTSKADFECETDGASYHSFRSRIGDSGDWTAAIYGDGRAEFAGDISALGYAASVGAGPNAYVFAGYNDEDSTTLTTSIDRHGAATFAGSMTSGNVGSGNYAVLSSTSLGWYVSNSNTVYINGSTGAATFASYVKSTNGNGSAFLGASSGTGVAVNDSTNATKIELNYDGSAAFAGNITAGNVSDIKFKENIEAAPSQLSDISAFELKTFDWKDEAPLSDELKSQRKLGLIAQEVEAICPEMVYEVAGQDKDVYKAINHDVLIMKLLGAVKELAAEVAALKAS